VQVRSSSNSQAQASDTATALLLPAFSFGPATQPTFGNALPGKTAVFTHTLTNLGNGTDTFTVTVAPPAGWSADPIAPITLARGASQPIVVRVHVPAGQTAGSYTLDVTAGRASSPTPPPQTQTDTVGVVGAAVPELSPGQTRNALPPLPRTLTFTHTLTNTGTLTAGFELTATLESAAAGWSADVIPPACDLVPGATCAITVEVTIPAGATAGAQNITLTSSTAGPPAASDSVTDTVVVSAVPGLLFAPDYPNGSGDPGAVVTYTHTLTNTGNGTDSYTITLRADPGWTATVSPTLVANVSSGAARSVLVSVTVPNNIQAGSTGTVTATATSAHAPFPQDSVTDRTTANAIIGASLEPTEQSMTANSSSTLSDTVTFIHTLRNTGSISASYVLTKSASLSWASALTPTETGPLLPGQSAPVTLTVTVPAGTPSSSPPNILTIGVADTTNPGEQLAAAYDTTLVGPQAGVLLTPQTIGQSALPGATAIYTHTLKNTGATTDTFVLTAMSPNGWDTSVAPSSIDLPSEASTTISVTVRVPTSAISGTLDSTMLRAQSLTDNDVFGKAQDDTTVLHVAGLSLSPSRTLPPALGAMVSFQHTLVNTGNGDDTFLLTATLSSTSAISWPVTLTPSSISLPPGGTNASIAVQVAVPANLPLLARAQVVVTATSLSDPSVREQVVDTISSLGQIGNRYFLHLPVILHGQAIPAAVTQERRR
jgi:uncharacterized membrane protein